MQRSTLLHYSISIVSSYELQLHQKETDARTKEVIPEGTQHLTFLLKILMFHLCNPIFSIKCDKLSTANRSSIPEA